MTAARFPSAFLFSLVWLCGAPERVAAHCDGLDGPVVLAARKALEKGNVNLALTWVQPDDEAAVKAVFLEALAVRKLGPQAKELADRHFFEAVVRLHRAGEGAPYTGLKPAGQDLGPAIPAADKAVDSGSARPLAEMIDRAVHNGLEERLRRVLAKRGHAPDDLAAGREFVAAYVEWVHYVEGLYQAAKPAHSRSHEQSPAAPPHSH